MNTTLTPKEISSVALQKMQEQLREILQHVERESQAKQHMIEHQRRELQQVHDRLADCRRHSEGQQQLINKLLNDISQYQLDIDWYRRTYERRTFLGVIKEKLFRK